MKIILEQFEGPFELLFHLIEKNQMDLYDISISTITEQYFSYLASMKQFNLTIASEFLVMASTLVEIKSKMLLPQYQASLQADEVEDPRDELVQQLLAYKQVQEIAKWLVHKEYEAEPYLVRDQELIPVDEAQLMLEDVRSMDLLSAFQKIMDRFEGSQELIDTIPQFKMKAKQFTIQDGIRSVRNQLKKSKISFEDCFPPGEPVAYYISVFLGILELLKQEEIRIETGDDQGLILSRNEVSA
jgi:segregation and condensation protein A